MKIDTPAKFLTAEAKPYDIQGNSGTSYKIRLNIEGEIYVCKSNSEQVAEYKKYEGKDGTATIKVNSRKENMSLELLDFQEE